MVRKVVADLVLVLVVAEGDAAAQGQHPVSPASRLDVPPVGIDDPDLGPEGELSGGAAEVPDETEVPMPIASDEEKASISSMPGWWRSRPCLVSSLHITPDEMMPDQAGQVPPAGMGVEGGQDRFGEDVPDDDQAVDLLALDGVEELDRVELAGGQGDHPSPLAEALERGEAPGAVHQRAGREQGHARPARAASSAPDLVGPPSSG